MALLCYVSLVDSNNNNDTENGYVYWDRSVIYEYIKLNPYFPWSHHHMWTAGPISLTLLVFLSYQLSRNAKGYILSR